MSSSRAPKLLEGVRVLDLGTGFSGALAAHLMAELSATVVRVQPEGVDPFLDLSLAYRLWRAEQIGRQKTTANDLDDLLADSDVCVIGGDDYPDVSRTFDARVLAGKHDRLVVLEISGTCAGSSKGEMPANDLLAQARSGIVNERFSDRPISLGVHLPTYGAVLHGVIAASAALFEREQSGHGDIVSTSLVQGAAAFLGPVWQETEQTNEMSGIIPRDVEWQFFECADGRWLTFHQGVPGSRAKMHHILGVELAPGSETARWKPTSDDPKLYFGITEELKAKARTWQSDDLLAALVDAGIAAELVRAPGACWSDGQVQENQLIRHYPYGFQGVAAPIRATSEVAV